MRQNHILNFFDICHESNPNLMLPVIVSLDQDMQNGKLKNFAKNVRYLHSNDRVI